MGLLFFRFSHSLFFFASCLCYTSASMQPDFLYSPTHLCNLCSRKDSRTRLTYRRTCLFSDDPCLRNRFSRKTPKSRTEIHCTLLGVCCCEPAPEVRGANDSSAVTPTEDENRVHFLPQSCYAGTGPQRIDFFSLDCRHSTKNPETMETRWWV